MSRNKEDPSSARLLGIRFDREMIAYATFEHTAVAMTRQVALD